MTNETMPPMDPIRKKAVEQRQAEQMEEQRRTPVSDTDIPADDLHSDTPTPLKDGETVRKEIREAQFAEIEKMSDVELRRVGLMRRFDGTICHIPPDLAACSPMPSTQARTVDRMSRIYRYMAARQIDAVAAWPEEKLMDAIEAADREQSCHFPEIDPDKFVSRWLGKMIFEDPRTDQKPKPQLSARERMAEAAAEIRAARAAALEKFSADLHHFCLARGYRLSAVPAFFKRDDSGLFQVGADIVILEVAAADGQADGTETE